MYITQHLQNGFDKTPFLGPYNGKPMANTYSHNCMMHKDMMLKFGTLFDLAKYVEFDLAKYVHKSFSVRGTARQGLAALTLNFGTLSYLGK